MKYIPEVVLMAVLFYVLGIFIPEVKTEAYLKGLQDGSNQYHQRCSEISGVMVDEGTLMAVHCRGLGKIDVKEIKKWLHS